MTTATNNSSEYIQTQLPEDVDALKALLIQAGGNPNSLSALRGEMLARDKARAEIRRRQQEAISGRGRLRAGIARFVTTSVEMVAVAFTVIIVLGGLTIATLLLLVADIAAVADGFETITTDNAMLYAVATVLFFIVVSFIYEIVAARSAIGGSERVISMRHFWRWLKYFAGVGSDWEEQYRASAPLVKLVGGAVRWLMWTIVLFGLLGRLAEKMQGATDAWHMALRRIVLESTLAEMGGYVGAVVMTVALLLAIRFVVYFVHQVFDRVTGGIDTASFFDDFSPDAIIDAEVTAYWKSEVLRAQQRQQMRRLAELSEKMPEAALTPKPSGNGSGH